MPARVSGDALFETEYLHAPPEPGECTSPCCGRTLDELPRYDRIVRNPDLVTCGRLSDTEQLMLSGQPVVLDPANDHILFSMASTVATLSFGELTLQDAYDCVNVAVRELIPPGRPLKKWTAELMVRVTARAQELARN